MATMTDHATIFDNAPLRLASRASQLAMAQTEMVCAALAPTAVTVRPVTTSGDRILDRPLVEAGGKGLFIKELERSLLGGEADLAVHSMKDVPAKINKIFSITSVMKREDPCDVFVSNKHKSLAKLSEEAIPYISVLTDPTMGGVSASLAVLGDINIAEPNALIGFAGPRVIEQTVREKLPKGFQRSEFLQEHGTIDMIVERKSQPDKIASILQILGFADGKKI